MVEIDSKVAYWCFLVFYFFDIYIAYINCCFCGIAFCIGVLVYGIGPGCIVWTKMEESVGSAMIKLTGQNWVTWKPRMEGILY